MKKNSIKKLLIIAISFVMITMAILVCINSFSVGGSKQLYPKKGVLDLQNWEPEQDGYLSLSGEWDFYWKRFITYKDYLYKSPVPDITVNAPDLWDNYKINGKNLSGIGYGTYVLKVINVQKGVPLLLRIPTFSTACELYIDDYLVASSGKVGKTKEDYMPECSTEVVEFTPKDTSIVLILYVSNFDNTIGGGMWNVINMGDPKQIKNFSNTILYKDLFLFGALSFMALYYLSFYLMRRKDKSSLYFALTCILIAGRILIYGDSLIRNIFPFLSFRAITSIDYISLCCFPVFTLLIVGRLFPEETSHKVLKVLSIYALVLTILLITTPVHFYSRLFYIVQIVAILMGPYAIFCLCTAFIKKRQDSLLMLVGAGTLAIAGVHDILFENSVIHSDLGDLVPIGLFVLLFLQSFVLSRRFSKSFEEVHTLSQKLLKMDTIKDEFLANTSHELRTPLSGILGITEAMLKGSDGELNYNQKQNLTIIAASSRRLANMVGDILDYSKMKNGDVLLNIRPIQIKGLTQTVVSVFQQLSHSKEYEILCEIPDNLPPVMADENRFIQILYNLVGNAVKFTIKGYIKLSARVAGNTVEVCISDTGEGIPHEKQSDIFKSFEQVDTSLTRSHGGTGLGLAITKYLVQLQGGNIRVESDPGVGSRFYFTLLAADEIPTVDETVIEHRNEGRTSAEFTAQYEQLTVTMENSSGNIKILLVDDDAVNLKSAAAILHLEGYGITTATGGKAALAELARQGDYALVILDVMMPEMSGYEVCKKLRVSRSNFELPVLILTAKASTADIVMGLESGANDYLPKPYEPEELLARVRTLINLKLSVDKSMAAETAFMQAQIKPHFMFNTLNAISSFCDTDPNRAQRLIDVFSNYLRQSFDFKSLDTYISLDKELSLVNSYVEIEKARFGEKINVEFDIDAVLETRIPMLSIQPLVENAIRHGIRQKGTDGTVTVSVKKVLMGVMVAVEDDGIGIPSDRLESLLSSDSKHGIGLWNIDRRLKKLFGYGLVIKSETGKGTRISYIVPSGGDIN